jgi:hypothetical protein
MKIYFLDINMAKETINVPIELKISGSLAIPLEGIAEALSGSTVPEYNELLVLREISGTGLTEDNPFYSSLIRILSHEPLETPNTYKWHFPQPEGASERYFGKSGDRDFARRLLALKKELLVTLNAEDTPYFLGLHVNYKRPTNVERLINSGGLTVIGMELSESVGPRGRCLISRCNGDLPDLRHDDIASRFVLGKYEAIGKPNLTRIILYGERI